MKEIVSQMFDSEGRPRLINLLYDEELDAKKAAAAVQKAMEQEVATAAAVAIGAAKPEACAKDIGFLDPTMTLDLQEFRISASSASFLHHLTESAATYQEKSVLKALEISLRGPALQWLKD